MRQEIYSYWGSLPAKVGAAAMGAASLFATLKPTKANAWLAWLMTREQTHFWGFVGIVAALTWLVVLLLLRPHPKEGREGLAQTSHGSQSPNFGTVLGNVIIATAEREEKMSPLVAAYARPKPPMRISRSAMLASQGLPPPEPDAALGAVLVRLYKLMGKPPQNSAERANYDRAINLEIADKVLAKSMSVWARIGDNPRKPIPAHVFEHAQFDHRKQTFSSLGIDAVYPLVYTDIRFNAAEINEIWPV